MRRQPLSIATASFAVMLAFAARAASNIPQELAVQGVLRNGTGQLQSGQAMVSVRFYDGAASINQLGATIGPNNIGVTGGLFTMTLPLGTAHMDAFAATAEVWMEITVAADTFPRTRVEPELFALFARAADSLSSGCVGCVTDAHLASGISASKISGSINSSSIQGVNVSMTAPTNGQTLVYNSSQTRWEPSSVAITLAGDVTGAHSATTVEKLRGVAVSSTTPTSGQVLKYNGTSWAPGNDVDLTSNQTAIAGIKNFTGSVGIGVAAPTTPLDVAGTVRSNGLTNVNSQLLNDYQTSSPTSNVYMTSPGSDRDAWIYRDGASPAVNWGIYHRQLDTTVKGLPGNSIGFIGTVSQTLQSYISLATGDAYHRGNLGIGTTTPSGRLHIAGSHANGILVDANDRPGVGITGTFPQVVLMSGGGNASHGATVMLGSYDSGSSGAHKHWSMGTAGMNSTFLEFGYYAGTDLNPHAGLRNSGVGSVILSLRNDGTALLGGALIQTSSQTKKKDIHFLDESELQRALALVKQTPIATYRYQTAPSSSKPGYGVIAERTPRALLSDDDKGLNVSSAVGVLLASVKAQQAHIEALEARLTTMERRARRR